MWRLTNIMAARKKKEMDKGQGYTREKFQFTLVLTALDSTQGLQ